MPKEVRHILFAPEEVFGALLDGLAAADPAWPYGPEQFRSDLATDATGAVQARLVMRFPRAGERATWAFNTDDLLAMLLNACRRARIPLPRRGQKRLDLVGAGLCLTITLGGVAGEPDVSRSAVRYPDPALAPLLARRRG